MKVITTKEFLNNFANQSPSEDTDRKIDQIVLEIIQQVRHSGDKALYEYTEKFDEVQLDQLAVTEEEFREADKQVSDSFRQALREAQQNIAEFHQNQMEKSWFVNKAPGVMLGQKVTPLEKVGVYIPGGKAAYPSSVLMNVIPARLAGVETVVITTPPQPDGSINPHVLVAAKEAGVDKVYKVGGAQAVAALAYGTETIPKTAKIVGPGNAFVARAKKWVYGDVAIDMIAGPSEICILADDTASPAYIAADLLSQAEHDEDARAICVTTSKSMADQVISEVRQQAAKLERKEIIDQSIEQHGSIILATNKEEAIHVVNTIAPEHLELMMENPQEELQYIKNAGAIFLGAYAPEPLGDYFAGPNHTLPTSGTAAFASPLGVYDFIKKSSIIQYSREALMQAASPIQTLAETEGLTAHSNAIQVRKDDSDAKA
ncbi:histidinol dehydrogenase [Virgibacillus xinjiangensis]|uniref:Histidinol dehydrogenase n=1 Tax=Virgibacillus xinjiangensis TaxID=393090 RepID=A0ABV7CV26_9BACI